MAVPLVANHPLGAKLTAILTQPTGTTTAGYPFLELRAWEAFRDGVPHLFRMGLAVLELVKVIEQQLPSLDVDPAQAENIRRAAKVVRQIVHTATVTAPPNLWLLRHVLEFFGKLDLLERLIDDHAIYPEDCFVERTSGRVRLEALELDTDLSFLLSLGIVEQYDDSYRMAGHRRVRRMLELVTAAPPRAVHHPTASWSTLFRGGRLETGTQEVLLDLCFPTPRREDFAQNHWIPTLEEVELGYRLVPVVLGLRAAGRTQDLRAGVELSARELSGEHSLCAAGALEVLTAAGWCEREGERYRVSSMGARGFSRGPGPFGIIETYHPYMEQGETILLEGRGKVWVHRGENVGASQDANRHTFALANDALDQLCTDTGFTYTVFIEHAVGRGEAIRQRSDREVEKALRYFAADLEDAAIDAALAEQQAGRLPANMVCVRGADIGKPAVLLAALYENGADARGAVMVVGNGFHEVRGQTDEEMVEVFRGYQGAGILLLFTEENALSIDDLRATAWNTYHAGFRYVHEKSGQGLRPAEPRPSVRLGRPLRAAWSECARRAGYVRADHYCSRTRTVYPHTPKSGHNPAISVNHFFVPATIAAELGLVAAP